jgi:hypothetical protein
MIDFDYWESLDVHCKYIQENWDERYKNTLKRHLNKFDEVNLFDLCELLGLLPDSMISSDAKKTYLNQLIDSKKALILGLLYEFSKWKSEIIYAHYIHLVEEKKLIEKRGNVFLKLVELFLMNNDELKTLLIQSNWIRTATFSSKYKSSIPLKIEFVKEFEKKINSFISKLRKGNYKNLKYKYFGNVSDQGKITFNIIRQTGDKLIKNIDKNKRNKIASDLLLCFDLKLDILEIRCKDSNVTKKALTALEDTIRVHFIAHMLELSEIDNAKFIKYLESDHLEEGVSVAGIGFKKTKIDGSVPIVIPASYAKNSIKESIEDLKNREIVEPLITNITSISIRYNEKIREIELKNTGTHIFYTLKKGSKLNDIELGELSNKIRNIFGFGLNEKFSLDHNDLKINYLEYIFSKKEINNHSVHLVEALAPLNENNIIKTVEQKFFQCTICRRRNPSLEKCTYCGSETNLIEHLTKIEFPRTKVVNFIINMLSERFSVDNKKAERTWSRKYEFLKINCDEIPVYIYISYNSLSAKIISFFTRSGLPIIIIQINQNKNEEISSLSNFTEVKLIDIIAEKITKSDFNNLIEETSKATNSSIVINAKESIRKLRKLEDYHHDYFEDDIVNVLQYIFKTVEKWGKEKKGKEIPEGLTYLTYKTQSGTNRRTFTWDCKYAYGEEYPLNINEKRKVESYIRSLNKSSEIKSFSTSLNAFFLISNSISESKFNNLSEYVISKIRGWKGNIVLLALKELILFYDYFDEKSHREEFNINEFKNKFSTLFLTKKLNDNNRIIIVTKEDIMSLF